MNQKQLNKKIFKALEGDYIEVEKRIHQSWKEFNYLKDKKLIKKQYFGRYQYIYKSPKGKISLVKLPNYFGDGVDWWEIYCLDGSLFKEDTQRFHTKKNAIEQIRKLLK